MKPVLSALCKLLGAQTKNRRPRSRSRKISHRPVLEPLEDRCVLTLFFPAEYGAQPTVVYPNVFGNILTGDVPVYLIFAGGSSTGFGYDGTVNESSIVNAVNNILASPYYSDLSEYGAATQAHVAGTYVSNYALPTSFSDNGNNSDINNLVSASITDGGGTLPEPDDTNPDGIYIVFTPPGYSIQGPGFIGHHSNGNTGSVFDEDNAYDGVVTSSAVTVPNPAPTQNEPASQLNYTKLSALDSITVILSHELGEMLTDPQDNGGVVVTPTSQFSSNFPTVAENPGEIGDNEAEFYVGYENGTRVQSYWSLQNAEYIVPGGTAQDVALNGQSLNIKGDSLGAANDNLTIGTTGAGGVQVTLDGETEQYAPGQVTQINVSLGADTNTVQLDSLPANVAISIDGSGGSTSVTSPAGSNTWQITGTGSGTLDNVVSFSAIQNLTAGGTDQFVFQPGGSVPGNILGGGSSTLDYSALAGPIAVNLANNTASNIGGTFSGISNFIGSAGSDTFIGPNSSSTWDINGSNSGSVNGSTFSSFENLTGGSAANQFVFLVGGSIAGNLDGSGGDTLDYSQLAGPVTVNLANNTASNIGDTFSGISSFIGSAGSDTLIGPDSPSTWDINGSNSGSVNGSTFSSFENLTGGSSADQFVFLVGGSIAGNLDGGGGGDTLDYSQLAGPVTVNLANNTAPNIGGTFANISNFIGSAGSDTLIGPDSPSTWDINGSNSGSVNGSTFSSFENLLGGSAADQFAFLPGGSIAGNLDGGGGSNTLDYSQFAAAVTIDLANNTATGIGGTFANITTFIGSAVSNTLAGPNTPTIWVLTGPNAVTVGPFTFVGFQNLLGGSSDDRFVIDSGASLSGTLDGGGGVNTLDYSNYAGGITVDLPLDLATAIGQGVFDIQNVTGSIGNDLMVGTAGANVLIGGTGRNVIIGGGGNDTIVGGGGDNILIAGSTIYDTNLPALSAIMAEWTRTDLSFEQRLAQLISNGNNDNRLNGSYVLNKKTVSSDGGNSSITGGGGLDWVFMNSDDDTFTNRKPRDHITGI
jgi:hypothetical protein